MTMTAEWEKASAALHAAERILLVTHLHPDGDAIGSLLGLNNALIERGKTSDAVVDGGVPEHLRFLPGSERVRSALFKGAWDLMISLDSSDEERTGVAGEFGRGHSKVVMNVDHHPTNAMFGGIHMVQPDAVSTTEIVYDWLAHMGQPLSRDVAIPLLTGLVTDTNGFRTSNITLRTLQLAQIFMEHGASLTEITARTVGSTPYRTVELWRDALQTVVLQDGIISAIITQDTLQKVKLPEPTDAGLISFLVSTNESRVAVVFKELADGRIELGFRSKPGYDVSLVALALGGGGHRQASGATISGPLDAAIARVMPMLREVVGQGILAIS
jgi:phosphoesterase RecJ-like protein